MKLNRHVIVILAYNNHELTTKNLTHLISLGYHEEILLFDNGSNPSFEKIADDLQIRFHREKHNIFVNPAWNKIFEQENCKYLTLLNNDCFILSPNYFEDVLQHMEKNEIQISSCKNKNMKALKNTTLATSNYFLLNNENKPLSCNYNSRRQGWLMTLNFSIYKSLDYRIPKYLKLWYGDDWIWSQFALNKFKMCIYKNRYSVHIKSSTISSSEMQIIIDDDNKNLEKYGKWYKKISPFIHMRTRLFSRYV